MKIFLKTPHWILFLIMFIPMVITSENDFLSILRIISMLVYILWIISIGNVLSQSLAPKKRNNKYFLFTSIFILLFFVVVLIISPNGYSINQNNYKEYGNTLWLIIPLHLYLMWSILYIFYFSSKMIVKNCDKNIKSETIAKYFFAFWFFPIGVWHIQPRVNDLINKQP
jgi:threonine/homoserine/homoserine lactone efflux protein